LGNQSRNVLFVCAHQTSIQASHYQGDLFPSFPLPPQGYPLTLPLLPAGTAIPWKGEFWGMAMPERVNPQPRLRQPDSDFRFPFRRHFQLRKRRLTRKSKTDEACEETLLPAIPAFHNSLFEALLLFDLSLVIEGRFLLKITVLFGLTRLSQGGGRQAKPRQPNRGSQEDAIPQIYNNVRGSGRPMAAARFEKMMAQMI
jgi:hypothetical protein